MCPTKWQKSLHPATYHDKIRVLHEGIDTNAVAPNPSARITLNAGLSFAAGDEVITLANRYLEPYRSYHIFMQALPEILRCRPKAHVLIVGGDGVSYGSRFEGKSWRDHFYNQVKEQIDTSRVHFLGRCSRS